PRRCSSATTLPSPRRSSPGGSPAGAPVRRSTWTAASSCREETAMPSVLYAHTDRLVTITINRPEAMNAIDPETHQALIDAWTRFRDDDTAWVAILTGAGDRAFSAGADLKKLIPAVFAAEPQRGRGRHHNDLGLAG